MPLICYRFLSLQYNKFLLYKFKLYLKLLSSSTFLCRRVRMFNMFVIFRELCCCNVTVSLYQTFHQNLKEHRLLLINKQVYDTRLNSFQEWRPKKAMFRLLGTNTFNVFQHMILLRVFFFDWQRTPHIFCTSNV